MSSMLGALTQSDGAASDEPTWADVIARNEKLEEQIWIAEGIAAHRHMALLGAQLAYDAAREQPWHSASASLVVLERAIARFESLYEESRAQTSNLNFEWLRLHEILEQRRRAEKRPKP